MKCNTCQNELYCYDGNHQLTRDRCADNGFAAYVPQTNADRIRAMTDEELAHFMTPENYKFPCPPNHIDCQYELIPCWMCWAKWLKAPAEEGK